MYLFCLQELEAHIEVFANLHKLGLPTPVIPDVDGLHHDWTLLGKKIQAKVARCRTKRKSWIAMHQEHLGRGNSRAVSYGAYDFLWIHLGVDKFILIPASILRRHLTYLGTPSRPRVLLIFFISFILTRQGPSRGRVIEYLFLFL